MRAWAAAMVVAPFLTDLALAQLLPSEFSDGVIELGIQSVPFSTSDIVKVDDFEMDGLFWTEITLSPRLDAQVATLTKDRIGYELWITLCGSRIVKSRLQTELATATFVITTGDQLDAEKIASFFRSPPCAPAS